MLASKPKKSDVVITLFTDSPKEWLFAIFLPADLEMPKSNKAKYPKKVIIIKNTPYKSNPKCLRYIGIDIIATRAGINRPNKLYRVNLVINLRENKIIYIFF